MLAALATTLVLQTATDATSPIQIQAASALQRPALPERPAWAINCSCARQDLCWPLGTRPPQTELFVYYLFGAPVLADAFENIDWNRVTTVASIHAPPDALICAAHARARRVVFSVDPGRSSYICVLRSRQQHRDRGSGAPPRWIRVRSCSVQIEYTLM